VVLSVFRQSTFLGSSAAWERYAFLWRSRLPVFSCPPVQEERRSTQRISPTGFWCFHLLTFRELPIAEDARKYGEVPRKGKYLHQVPAIRHGAEETGTAAVDPSMTHELSPGSLVNVPLGDVRRTPGWLGLIELRIRGGQDGINRGPRLGRPDTESHR